MERTNEPLWLLNRITFTSDSLKFKLYGQQCQKCDDEDFQKPMWYEEEVRKVLTNVHKKIGEVCLHPTTALAYPGMIFKHFLCRTKT